MSKKSKLLSLLLAFTLLFSTTNISALASGFTSITDEYSSKNSFEKALSIKETRLLELLVLDIETNEYYSTSLLLLPSAEWDESLLNQLDKRYLLINYKYEYFEEGDEKPLIVVEPDGMIRVAAVESIFDIGMFTMSLFEFIVEPTFWNGFWVVADGLSVVFPGIPAVSGVKRMIKSSSTLKTAMKTGVMSYGDIRKKSIPYGWERHHIFEKRFKYRLSGATDNNMLAIPIPKTYHYQITSKMRQKIPYNDKGYSHLTQSQIISAHRQAYLELWQSTGDPYWEFLYRFSQTGQYRKK